MRETIDMARDALIVPFFLKATNDEHLVCLKAFEALVRADERNRTWTQEHWTDYERSIAAAEREAVIKLLIELKVVSAEGTLIEAIRNRGQA
jgi:hypothetical protein